jgi:uncharacterized membrane protein YfcA
MVTAAQALLLIAASAVAGAINSVAGGGTLVTFPTLVAAGTLEKVANATNTVALWPGQLSSLWGYRREVGQTARSVAPLLGIGLAGGVIGAELLIYTPASAFKAAAPFLVLTATVLFLVQDRVSRWLKARAAAAGEADALAVPAPSDSPNDAPAPEAPPAQALRLTPGVSLFLLGVAIYGGYFGAGIGILTLAALGLLGLTDLHQMNGVKNIFTLGINGVAAVLFMVQRIVDWPLVGVMVVGSLLGGYAGAGIAKKIGQKNTRRLVIAVGFLSAGWLLIQLFLGRR